MYGLEIIAC